MAGALLYTISGHGQKFTPWGFREAQNALVPLDVGPLGEVSADGDLVSRTALSASRRQSRTVAYKLDASIPGGLSAVEWWDQRLDADENGNTVNARLDILTGSFVVEDSFLAPSGIATGWSRLVGGANDDSLAPAIIARGGEWQVSGLISLSPEELHAALVSGDDVIEGSPSDDEIAGGPGLNYLYGREGADSFYFQSGAASKWYSKRQKHAGLEIAPLKGRFLRGKQRYAYDPDVSIVYDFEKGVDHLFLPGNSGAYSYGEANGNSLVYTDKNNRNLLAVIVDVSNLKAVDFLGY